jgi:hypothetical protein
MIVSLLQGRVPLQLADFRAGELKQPVIVCLVGLEDKPNHALRCWKSLAARKGKECV